MIRYYAQETAVRRYVPVEDETRVIRKMEESPLHLEPVKEEEVEKEIVPLQANEPTVIRCTRTHCEKLNRYTTSTDGMKKNSSSITSHGGTFHVSKQVAPVASPTSSRYKT